MDCEQILLLPFPFRNMTRLYRLYIGGYTLGEVKHLFQPSIRTLSLLLQDGMAEEQNKEDENENIAPRLDELLQVLRGMPLLENIDISTWLDNAPPFPSTFPVISP